MHKRSESEVRRRIAAKVPRETYPAAAHQVHHYLQLVAALGANTEPLPPRLQVREDELRALRVRFPGLGHSPVFALNAGAEYGPAKRWPADRFIEAAVRLHERSACHWFVLGSSLDREIASRIATEVAARIGANRVTNVAGETSLRDLCVLLRACELVLTNDTGPMHLAAAVGSAVIVPFGSTAPELTGPFGGAKASGSLVVGQAECAPCFRRECPVDFRCMHSISVAQVVEAGLHAWRIRGGVGS